MRKAFTLEELLIVIAIIAILASIAIPQYTKYVTKAAAANAEATLSACMSTAAAQFADEGTKDYTCNLPTDVTAGADQDANATSSITISLNNDGTFTGFKIGNANATQEIYLKVKGHIVKCTGNETTNTVNCQPV